MDKVFHKVTVLYHPKQFMNNDKERKLASNSIEPSQRKTFGKFQQNLKNENLNEKNKKNVPNKDKEKRKVFSQKEITEFPKINNKKKDSKKEEIRKIHEKTKKNEKYYLAREIALTVEKYGRDIFSDIIRNEIRLLIPVNFMDKHPISSNVRERMVDWMVEVFSVYKCDPGTFELAVHIMDSFFSKTRKKLKDDDIHLIGLTCIYISSKFEDMVPLRMSHIAKSIGHSTFSEKKIIRKEREIIKTIDFDLFTAGTYDYIMTFFYDLKVNNAKKISDLNGVKIVEKFLNFSIFLSQLLLYHYEFVCFRQCINALAVLALAFDILKTNIKDINKDLQNLLSDWIFFVINEMGFNSDSISLIYQKIYNLYREKVILPQKLKEKSKGNGINEDNEIEIINLCKFNQDKFI